MPGISAQGTLIARSPDPNWPDFDPAGGAVTFTEIAELRDITMPALTRNEIETTTHNQLDDQYIVGIRRHGTVTFDMNFLPRHATHDHLTGLQKAWFDGTRDIYRITTPDGATGTAWLFSGFISNLAPSAPVDDRLSSATTIRPTGRHDWVVNATTFMAGRRVASIGDVGSAAGVESEGQQRPEIPQGVPGQPQPGQAFPPPGPGFGR
jgi:hypothetical protein